MNLNQMLTGLRVIAELKEGQKLDFSDQKITICEDTWSTYMWRKIKGENKYTMCDKLSYFYKQINMYSETLVLVLKADFTIEKMQEIDQIIPLIRLANIGLDNLKITYADFHTIPPIIDGIKNDQGEQICLRLEEFKRTKKNVKETKG